MSGILHLTLKRQWFDAIFFGDKREEYRELKPYWTRRLVGNWQDYQHNPPAYRSQLQMPKGVTQICFRNGYQKDARAFCIEWMGLEVNTPRTNWCPLDTDYAQAVYVLKLGGILTNNFT